MREDFVGAAHDLGKERGLGALGLEKVVRPNPRAPEAAEGGVDDVGKRNALGRWVRKIDASDGASLEGDAGDEAGDGVRSEATIRLDHGEGALHEGAQGPGAASSLARRSKSELDMAIGRREKQGRLFGRGGIPRQEVSRGDGR
ncbi:hypothetical protein [Polyangium sp. 6x1]|uniref:hypothetical protein n=1 Tax=Polyangium sp. 6x1 TaxID=3042689 RepID=UPI00248250B2|nr:hypothetical protein [Polyangium sp. 6x1]MDI1445742.1 hypothetical protein [Polyangium sp. 6x1]